MGLGSDGGHPVDGFPMNRCCFILLLFFGVRSAVGHDHPQHETAELMAEAATAFLGALDDDDRADAVLSLESAERENFHYVPLRRRGVVFKDLNPAQRELALELLRTALSVSGARQARQIMELEAILRGLENGAPHRDPELYYVTVFGEPGELPWGWRFEGHHLSVNQTVTADGISGTPLFFGANPARISAGPRAGERILGETEDAGRAFVLSLSDVQRDHAVIADRAPFEIETGQRPRVDPLKPAGLPYAEMTAAQQEALRALVQLYLDRHAHEIAVASRERIAAHGFGNLVFAWAGPLEAGRGHYYRVQGPTFVIEYANTQNDANHHHTVFRDFERDFGRDLLGDHMRTQHGHE